MNGISEVIGREYLKSLNGISDVLGVEYENIKDQDRWEIVFINGFK